MTVKKKKAKQKKLPKKNKKNIKEKKKFPKINKTRIKKQRIRKNKTRIIPSRN